MKYSNNKKIFLKSISSNNDMALDAKNFNAVDLPMIIESKGITPKVRSFFLVYREIIKGKYKSGEIKIIALNGIDFDYCTKIDFPCSGGTIGVLESSFTNSVTSELFKKLAELNCEFSNKDKDPDINKHSEMVNHLAPRIL